mmetsp:Transcript_6816/g.17417  ORF Transcript_6816/g.17417 Transcript_6816/m.17417 type:complete len:365 (-) Transcript_6816:588-1682(-)
MSMSMPCSLTTGRLLTPFSSSIDSAVVSGVAAVTVLSAPTWRRPPRPLCASLSPPGGASSGAPTHVPNGSEPSGWLSSGSEDRLARKWRSRQASTPLMVAMCSRLGMAPSSAAGSQLRMGAIEWPPSYRVATTVRSESSGRQYTSSSCSPAPSAISSRRCWMVCRSISCSLRGLLPPATLLRRWRRMWMKSLALIMPTMLAASVSHSGAEVIPCSCSAWKACRTGSSVSSSTTFPLSGISSYAVWLDRNSSTFFLVISAAACSGSSGCSAMGATTLCSVMSTSSETGATLACSLCAASACMDCCPNGSVCSVAVCPCGVICCPLWCGSARRTNSQLFTLPSGSGMLGCVSSCRHSPSTMNLYWW